MTDEVNSQPEVCWCHECNECGCELLCDQHRGIMTTIRQAKKGNYILDSRDKLR
jgi:CO dehydrogenase/acetyl-CoA synthase alpha subunit